VLIVLSLVMFTASVREGDGPGVFTTVRGAWMTITTPIRWVGGAVTAPFQGLGNIFANLTADQERLSELKAENERLVARNAELEESEQTARRLESLLGLQSLYNLQSTGARIISGSTDSWSSTVTIDKGTAAGIAVGMPVTDSNGAIGQIIRCGAASSTVRLVTDENSSVSAMVQSSRAQGVLRGSVDGTLHLTLVRTDQNVEVGDTVVTSGLGGVFPKGLPLGTVTSVERTSGALYYDIEVEPLSSTESFEEVLVITSLTEDQKPTAEEVAQADQQDSASRVEKSSKSDASGDSSDSGDGSADDAGESAGGEGAEDESEDQSQDEG
jgi:rod shape-determining protein MreC